MEGERRGGRNTVGEILYTSPISDPLNESALAGTHPHPSTAPQMSVTSKQDAHSKPLRKSNKEIESVF